MRPNPALNQTVHILSQAPGGTPSFDIWDTRQVRVTVPLISDTELIERSGIPASGHLVSPRLPLVDRTIQPVVARAGVRPTVWPLPRHGFPTRQLTDI